MAFVFLSHKALTHSKVRTVHSRTLALGVSAVVLLSVAGAGVVGYHFGLERAQTAANVPGFEVEPLIADLMPADASAGSLLINRLGELSGRLFRLESEAQTLAQRIDVIKKYEKRLKKPTPSKDTKGAKDSVGGPMMAPVGARVSGASLGFPIDLSDPNAALVAIEYELGRLDDLLGSVDQAASDRKLAHMLFPSRDPVKAERRSSSFGDRYDPFTGRRAFHSGLDFSAPTGTKIVASAGGKVTLAGYHREYGNRVEIDHGNGLVSRYAHASKLFVKKGDIVNPGQKIAAVGSTGRSTGPHLHFEIIENGKFVNPSHYLAGGA